MNNRNQHREVHQLLEYLRSRDLSAEEWASLEVLAADDAFLLDALEGLRQVPVAQRTAHLLSIQTALSAKYAEHKPVRRTMLWLRAAASILLVIGMFWIINEYVVKDRHSVIAEDVSLKTEPVVADDDMKDTDSMLMTEADQEMPAGSFDGPGIQSASTESFKEKETKDAANEIASAGTEKKAAAGERRENDIADGARPEPSARSAEPASREMQPSEALSTDDSGAAFLFPEVKGIVMNRSGDPVSGAQVSVKGTSTQTETDYLGNFALDIPNQNYRNALVISHEAYPVIEAEVADGDSLVVRMQGPASGEKADITTLTQQRVTQKVSPGSRSMATPMSGERAYQKYIRQNLQYPTQASNANIHGTVVVEFDITADGSPQNFRIVQSLGYGCDEEAIRLIREGPKWSGGQVNIGRWEIRF